MRGSVAREGSEREILDGEREADTLMWGWGWGLWFVVVVVSGCEGGSMDDDITFDFFSAEVLRKGVVHYGECTEKGEWFLLE